ncbi:MAG: hypothetical protein ACRDI0_03950 [Actinomycetota bacterium]
MLLVRRRARDRARGRLHAAADPDAAPDSFSPKLAPSLTGLGGALTVLGALGMWLRETRVTVEGGFPEQVGRVLGASEPAGWALAALGMAVVMGSLTWRSPGLVPKVGVVLASAGSIGISAWWLMRLDDRAASMAAAASADPQFASYSATFGWGAWLLLVAITLLGLGVVAGLLRELDLRRGGR